MINSKFVKYRIAVAFIRPDNGLKLRPSGFKLVLWPYQDGTSMYPVKKEIHDKIVGKHTGGREIVTQYPELKGFFNQE